MVAGNSVEGGFSCYFVEISRISGVCVCVYRRVLLPKTNRIESEIGSALSLFGYAPLELSTLQKLRRSGELQRQFMTQ